MVEAMQQASVVTPAKKTVRTAIAGVGGYAGGELFRLLRAHPRLRESAPLLLGRVADEAAEGAVPLDDLHPQLALGGDSNNGEVKSFSWELVEAEGTEIVFLALPHDVSRAWAPEWLARGVRVIDLSGAWRLNDARNRATYGLEDEDAALAATLQAQAVYGSPELHRAEIAEARLVANPGCYSTSIILALAPLLQAGLVDVDRGIVCDAKSGVSGAGKKSTAKTHFMYAADNLSAYAVFGHRHTGELLEQLRLRDEDIRFVPHLLPIPRGILSTIHLRLKEEGSTAALKACYSEFYAQSPMVRVRRGGMLPTIQDVVRTSYCDIGFELAPDKRRLVVVSCLDNLLKGASGQAVQNMNLMCGWHEEEGLL